MGEKIKDILYDLGDVLITLLIVVLIIGTVSWKISDSMTYSNALAKSQPPVISEETGTEAQTPEQSGTPENGDSESGQQASSEVQPSVNTLPASGSSSDSSSDSSSTPASGGATSPAASGEKFTIEIKSGSTGYAIAKLLVEKGLVTDTQTFIQRVEALKLGSKLKAGTFEVAKGMPLDDLIRVITGN
ncbi:MltG/YceG/YrrL family protein [Acidaminobacter hydrogenoformans]|uniref:YceG-like family protein n=1 Tax=Acidaminobacter hydrogenoformans DSM 2784 TaxID=1120920 RepID=A0A1G5S4M7_9FIRM|nr:endolytic transglycosylase MltG [Acidaminobacter hydrogenoformans]SCZ81276.1 hypothetical protein SAMN03080599_02701 [Acidaminobacter hydrogenoformans DSM 2784]